MTRYIYLPIRRCWLGMIKQGLKNEEYRAIKRRNWLQFQKVNKWLSSGDEVVIRFHCYRGTEHEARINSARIGRGNTALGAPENEYVFIYELS